MKKYHDLNYCVDSDTNHSMEKIEVKKQECIPKLFWTSNL